MPNNVINEVVFEGLSAHKAAEILRLVGDKDGNIDFETLLPFPLQIWWGSVGSQHEKAFKAGTALDWATTNWGTKWNAYGNKSAVFGDGTLTLTFKTAWQTPRGWLCALLNAGKASFECRWLSEGDWKGHLEQFISCPTDHWTQVEWKDTEIEEGCEMHKHLHFLLWGFESFPAEEEDAELAATPDPEKAGK